MRCLLGLFVWPVGSHLVWMMAAVRVPLASVTPTMAAWSHVAYSASCSGYVALQWAWLIVAEVSTPLLSTMLNAARASATLATAVADQGKAAARCSWLAGLRLQQPGCGKCGGVSVWASAAQADRLWRERFWWSKQLWLLVQQVITLVESAGWAGAAMNTTTTSVTDCCWGEQDSVKHCSCYSVSSSSGVWGW